MNGTNNAATLQALIQTVDGSNLVSGNPGSFSVSLVHPVMAFALSAGTVAGAAAPPVSYGQAAVVENAVAKSNAAASATPSAASGNPTTANTPINVITSVIKGLSTLASIPQDLQVMEAGASATLHWWGWSLTLNESATQAFLDLLKTDLSELGAILAALTAVSAPLAAAGAIIAAVSTGLNQWVSAADTQKSGVKIDGYLWVGVAVQSN